MNFHNLNYTKISVLEYLKIHIGKQINQLRQKAGLSQQQLADMSGTSQGSVANIERGEQLPPIDRLFMFAGVIGCEITDFLPTKDQFIVSLFIHYKK